MTLEEMGLAVGTVLMVGSQFLNLEFTVRHVKTGRARELFSSTRIEIDRYGWKTIPYELSTSLVIAMILVTIHPLVSIMFTCMMAGSTLTLYFADRKKMKLL